MMGQIPPEQSADFSGRLIFIRQSAIVCLLINIDLGHTTVRR